MVLAVVNVHKEGGGGSLSFESFNFRLVSLCGLEIGVIGTAGDKDARPHIRLIRDLTPMIPRVMVIVVAVIVAPNVAHFVEKGVAIALLVAVIEIGNLDSVAQTPPLSLTESTAGVGKDKGNFRHIKLKDLAVELVVPILKEGDSNLHSFGILVVPYIVQIVCQRPEKLQVSLRKLDWGFILFPPTQSEFFAIFLYLNLFRLYIEDMAFVDHKAVHEDTNPVARVHEFSGRKTALDTDITDRATEHEIIVVNEQLPLRVVDEGFHVLADEVGGGGDAEMCFHLVGCFWLLFLL